MKKFNQKITYNSNTINNLVQIPPNSHALNEWKFSEMSWTTKIDEYKQHANQSLIKLKRAFYADM